MDTNRNVNRQNRTILASQHASRTVVRNLNLSCPKTNQLDQHFNDSVVSLAFHKDILKENLDCILKLSSRLQIMLMDNIKILLRDNCELCNEEIKLPYLKQMNLSIIQQPLVQADSNSSQNTTLALNPHTLEMLSYLKRVTYGSLEEINIECTMEQLSLLPLPAPFVPEYIIESLDSLTELIYNNRCTLHHLTIGPDKDASQKLILQMRPPVEGPKPEAEEESTDHETFDHTFKSITEIPNRKPTQFVRMTTAYDYPFPEWWVGMLVHQTVLTQLFITLTDEKVLCAAIDAAANSSDTLEALHIRIIGNSNIEIDLEKLKKCYKMESFSLTSFESKISVTNCRFLPENIVDLKLSGTVCDSTIDAIVKTVPNVKALLICLNKSEYPGTDTFSVINWPAFTHIMDFRRLERMVIQSQRLHLNWDEITEWSKSMDWCIGVTRHPSEENDTEEIVMQIVPLVEAEISKDPANNLFMKESSSLVSSWCNCIGL